jgi:hypothetical protein
MSKRRKTAVPLGKPLDTDDAALDLMALITPEDIAAAQADARARMGKKGATLLEAERAEVEDEDER